MDCWGGFALALGAAAAPSGAVESIVVCWADAESEGFGTVEGRVGFGTGLTVVRDAAVPVVDVAVELGVGFGFAAVAVAVDDFAGASR